MKTTLIIALGAMALAQNAHAVEVTGGTLQIGHSAFTDDTSVSSTSFTGGLEVGFNRSFALQFDLGLYGLNTINETGTNAAIHAVYHVNETASLGFFLGHDDIAGSADFYGIEGGFALPGVDVELYLANEDDNVSSGDLFGLELHHDISEEVGITGTFDHASFGGGVDLTRFKIGMNYNLSPTSELYGEVGSLNASALGLSGSESFVGIGARINFGAARGVTFKRRGLLSMLPGL